MTSRFFARCKRKNRRFSGAKSRFFRVADRKKDAVSVAAELISASLILYICSIWNKYMLKVIDAISKIFANMH